MRRKLTKAQRRLLKQAANQDATVWLDMATDIQKAMFWKMERRGYLYLQQNWFLDGYGYGVVDVFETIYLTDKGFREVQP